MFTTWLFDLDGTLVDHFDAIFRAHAHTMRQLGLPPPSMDQVRAAVGRGLEKAVETLVGPERVDAALAIYRPYWDATMLDDVRLFPGARELLALLHGRGARLAILTNKHAPSSRLICKHLGIAPFLDAVFGAGDTPWLKPQPEFTRHALTQLRAEASTAVLVGDSIYDVATARNAALASWCVTTGTHTAPELRAAGADRIFPDLPALGRVLESQLSS
ncbi:MAG TPA: HAD family hydrolase [Opitutus sp.]|nr:HAD family hydrolase [Opitutus sp.]